MPRDGSGQYFLPAGNPVATNTIIASAWANTTLSDIAAQLNNVLTRDGLLGPVGPFKIVDGTVNVPGLAFNSEPGLGWYRSGASVLRVAAGGVIVESLDASTVAQTVLAVGPRTPGTGTLAVRSSATGSPNVNQLTLNANSSGYSIIENTSGTATAKPLTFNFPAGVSMVGAFSGSSTGTFGGIVAATEFDIRDGNVFGLNFKDTVQQTKYIALGDPGYGAQFQMAFLHQPGVWAGIRFQCSAGGQFQFTTDGQAHATVTGPWTALVSDARIKDRIEDYTDGLDAILALRPRVFSFREGTGHDTTKRWISLIAQEAMEAMPVIVNPATVTKVGDIEHDDLLTVDSGPVTWALVNAIKTLHQRLSQLEHA